jgi:hypothetical protein
MTLKEVQQGVAPLNELPHALFSVPQRQKNLPSPKIQNNNVPAIV